MLQDINSDMLLAPLFGSTCCNRKPYIIEPLVGLIDDVSNWHKGSIYTADEHLYKPHFRKDYTLYECVVICKVHIILYANFYFQF